MKKWIMISTCLSAVFTESAPLYMVQNKSNHQKSNIWMMEVILKQLLRQNPIAA